MSFESAVLAFIGTIGAALVGTAIYFFVLHPCVRYESRDSTCGGDLYCVAYDSEDWHCLLYDTHPEYPCTEQVCVERKP